MHRERPRTDSKRHSYNIHVHDFVYMCMPVLCLVVLVFLCLAGRAFLRDGGPINFRENVLMTVLSSTCIHLSTCI